MAHPNHSDPPATPDHTATSEDVKLLHTMGYAQELLRRMSGFSNFPISFSIICILAGGITSLQLGISAVGGAAAGVVWPVGVIFALLVTLCMAQIASAYPAAGGLYHWSSILGGRGWGWWTAWFSLLGVICVVSSVDVGVWILFQNMIVKGLFGVDTTALADTTIGGYGYFIQAIAVIGIVGSQAIFNHIGIRATTILTDFSGYLIFVVAVVLTIALLVTAPTLDFSRLFTFANNTGDPGGGIWPANG